MRMIPNLVLAAAMIMVVTAAEAATKSLGEFGDWLARSDSDGKGKVCYAIAAAKKTDGGTAGRKPTYLAITHRATSKDEVSLIGSYGFKKDSDAELKVENDKFPFFTQEDSAWSKQPDSDKQIIVKLRKGKEAVVRATPAKGKPVVDTISLTGFEKALTAIDKECGVKRAAPAPAKAEDKKKSAAPAPKPKH